MNILKELQKRRDQNKLINSRNTAIEIFQEQKKDLEGITGTKGFNLINKYFLGQIEICYGLLKTLDPKKQSDEIMRTQENLKLAENFLNFINTRK